MCLKKAIEAEEKIRYVQEYMDGKISQSEIARKLGIKKESVKADSRFVYQPERKQGAAANRQRLAL